MPLGNHRLLRLSGTFRVYSNPLNLNICLSFLSRGFLCPHHLRPRSHSTLTERRVVASSEAPTLSFCKFRSFSPACHSLGRWQRESFRPYSSPTHFKPNMDRSSPTKRKHPPTPSNDRPLKQFKPELAATDIEANGLNGDRSHDASMEYEDEEILPLTNVVSGADTAEWQATIEKVVRNVVSIHFCQTCSFDTDGSISSEATGFVVDAEKGYILTNRHVVGAGPFWGYAIFDNHEECDVYPVYRDPVHDFGILRFDPKMIKYMPLTALPLRPDQARMYIRISLLDQTDHSCRCGCGDSCCG